MCQPASKSPPFWRQDCGRPLPSSHRLFDTLPIVVHHDQNLLPHEQFLPLCSWDTHSDTHSNPPPPLNLCITIMQNSTIFMSFNNLFYFMFFLLFLSIFKLLCHSCTALPSLFINHPTLMSLFVYIVYKIVTVYCLLSSMHVPYSLRHSSLV